MNRGIITISETGTVTMPTASVWMTQFEIADLFGVFSCDVRKAIHTIYKHKELNELGTMKYLKQPDGISYDVYNIEVIIAVAFIPSATRSRYTDAKVAYGLMAAARSGGKPFRAESRIQPENLANACHTLEEHPATETSD